MKNLDPIVSSGVNGSDCLAGGPAGRTLRAGALKKHVPAHYFFPRAAGSVYSHICLLKMVHLKREANGAGLRPTTSSSPAQLEICIKLLFVSSLDHSPGRSLTLLGCTRSPSEVVSDSSFSLVATDMSACFLGHLRAHLRELSARRWNYAANLSRLTGSGCGAHRSERRTGSGCSCACLSLSVRQSVSVCLSLSVCAFDEARQTGA